MDVEKKKEVSVEVEKRIRNVQRVTQKVCTHSVNCIFAKPCGLCC